MLNLYAVKANDGVYVSLNPRNEYTYTNYNDGQGKDAKRFLFDGKPGEETFHSMWVKIPAEPTRMSHMVKPPRVYGNFRLIDESLASESIPLELTFDDVLPNDGYWTAREHLQSLYQRLFTDPPAEEVDDEFQLIVLAEVAAVDAPEKMCYMVQRTQYAHQGLIASTNADVQHQEFDRVFFPSLLLHETPAKLTSEQVYKIIREHVKTNINPQAAEITSDYEFCFTVKKRVRLARPYVTQRESGRGKRARLVNVRTDTKLLTCFEMTHAGSNYKGYEPIPAMVADSETKLKQKMDAYLEDLMDYINEPLAECSHCNGVGMIFNREGDKPAFPR